MLRRRVEPNVVQHYRREKGVNDFERLDGAVEVLVIDGVFIVVHPRIWSCHLVTDKENAVISVIRFTLVYRCSGPSLNGRLLSHRVAHEIKGERLVDSNYAALTVRCVVIHVALGGMTLAPGAFVRDDVFRFSKIGRPDV
jgi:hypothetical protein